MRYDTTIKFITETEGYYDFDLGEHVEGRTTEDVVKANVTDLGTERSVTIFGDVKENAKVIRLLRHYDKPFQSVFVGTTKYQVIKTLDLRQKQTLIVQEVAN